MVQVVEDILTETFKAFRSCGMGKCECVVYWTGPADQSLVDGFEHPVHQRSPFGYAIDDRWLTDFLWRLARSHRSVRAQAHTHPGRAFHSETDDTWPIVSQPGFLSIVIPNFAAGRPSLENAWVGRLRPNGEWEQLDSPSEALVLR